MPKAQHYQPNNSLSPNYNRFAALEDSSDSSSERIRIKMAEDINKNHQTPAPEVAIATVADATLTLLTTPRSTPTGSNRVIRSNRRAAARGLKPYRGTQQQECRMLKHAIQTMLTSRQHSLKKMIAPKQAQDIIKQIEDDPRNYPSLYTLIMDHHGHYFSPREYGH